MRWPFITGSPLRSRKPACEGGKSTLRGISVGFKEARMGTVLLCLGSDAALENCAISSSVSRRGDEELLRCNVFSSHFEKHPPPLHPPPLSLRGDNSSWKIFRAKNVNLRARYEIGYCEYSTITKGNEAPLTAEVWRCVTFLRCLPCAVTKP